MDLGDMVILYISFKMGATVQGVYSSEEFVRGMTALGCVRSAFRAVSLHELLLQRFNAERRRGFAKCLFRFFFVGLQGEHGCSAESEAAGAASTNGDACRSRCTAHVGIRLQLRARAAICYTRCCKGCVA